jgi:hypothetical protein
MIKSNQGMGILPIIVIIAVIALAVMIFTKDPVEVEAPAAETTEVTAEVVVEEEEVTAAVTEEVVVEEEVVAEVAE